MTMDPNQPYGIDRRTMLAGAATGVLAGDQPAAGTASRPAAPDNGLIRSLFDFLPFGRIAAIREGNSTWDAADAINRGIRDMGPGAIISPSGATYTLGQPIDLLRGTALRHLGSFDDMPGKGAIIKMLPGANCAAIRTPAAAGGEPTHFTCLEGFCIDGASATQTRATRRGAVQWWGEFIGSDIRRVMIKDTLGPALTLGRGADVLIEHLWAVGACLPDGGYAFDTNIDETGDIRGGLVTMNHVFVENPARVRNGQPRHREDDRGNAIRLHRMASVHIGRLHIEGARRSLSIESCDQVDIGLLSGTWLGHPADPDRSFVDLADAHTRAIRINSIGCLTGGLPLVRKRQGVTSDSLPDLEASAYGMNTGYAAVNDMANGDAVAAPTRFANQLSVTAVGATERAALLLAAPSSGTNARISLDKGRLEIATTSSGGDTPVAFTAPVSFGTAKGNAPENALVTHDGGVAIGRAAHAPDRVVTFRIAVRPPQGAPDAVGILLYQPSARRLWLSVGTATVADWIAMG